MNKYLGITIGPIDKTMKLASKTREFWGASILFSMLAKELCASLLRAGIKKEDFLVPDKSIIDFEIMNIGLYLDRIICKCPADLYDNLEVKVINPALKTLAESMQEVNDISFSDLKAYFKIYAVYHDVNPEKPLNEISGYLNTMEVFNRELSDLQNSVKLKKILENINTEYDDNGQTEGGSFLRKYFNLNDLNGQTRIQSISEISTVELFSINPTDYRTVLNSTIWKYRPNEPDLFTKLKDSFAGSLKNYHKYYCILQADGDKLGTTLLNSGKAKIENISTDLIAWGREMLQVLKDYNALPIFIGGDELVCFAPVACNGKTILDIAKKLNQAYISKPGLRQDSTLSIGIKISYYKSPMYEAYTSVYGLLQEAKKTGNACTVSYDKHSGQPHQFIYSFSNEDSDLIKKISDNMVVEENKKSFLASVMYKLKANEELIFIISHLPERLWYFFENNFEEAKSGRAGTKPYEYLKSISQFLYHLFAKYGNTKEKENDEYIATTTIYSVLKTIRFIKGLDDAK